MSKAIEKCKNAVMVLGFQYPHFILIHAKISGLYVEDNAQPTMAIAKSGRIHVNSEFVMNMDKEHLKGVLAHEMLHLILSHHDRQQGRDPWIWNVANDMCINNALKTDGISLPPGGLYPPAEYRGDLFSENLYDWLLKNPDHVPEKPKGTPAPGAGCGTLDDGTDPDWRQTAIEARAMAQQAGAGKGSAGFAGLLAPRAPKIDWKKVIRAGFEQAAGRPGRDSQTYARKSRRSPAEGPQFPGWIGHEPKIALSIDVSGSMSKEWVEKIVSEVKGLLKTFPGTKCYLNAHTSEVVYKDWVNDRTTGKVEEATQYSGGTDPMPAYDDISQQGKFDSMIHFTDCEFFTPEWPQVPMNVRHLIVGGFTRDPHTKPPPGSTYIPCEMQ